MARNLRLDVDSDASGARKGLDATARAVDHLADETNRLEREFAQASREASKLDRELLKTQAAAAALGREFARTNDKALISQIETHNKAAAEIKRVQASIVGDSEVKAKQSAKAWKSAFADLTKLGGAGAGLFGEGVPLLGMLAKHPGAAAAAAAIAVPASIGIGATVGGAIGAGVGAGVAGLTVAGAAAQSKAVHRAWSIEIEGIKGEFLSATAGAEGPTIAAIRRIGGAIRDIHMDEIFGKATTFIEPLSRGVTKGLSSLTSGIGHLVDRAGPYITALSHGAEQIGAGFEIAFNEIGDGADGGAMALEAFAHATATTIAAGGRFIGWAEDAVSAIDDLSHGLRTLPQVDLMANALGNSDEPKSIAWKLDFQKPDLGAILDDMGELKGSAKGAADAMERINGAFNEMFSSTMDVDRAADAYQKSLNDLKDTIKENGTAIQGNSAKALENRDAIRDVIDKIEEQRAATIRSGGSTQAAYEAANKVYLDQLQSLRTTLVQMHLNTDAIDAMIEKFKKVPPSIDTDFNIHVRIATTSSTNVNGKKVTGGEGGTIPIKGFFADGGSVPGPPGSPALIMAHGGEYVLSRDMLRGFKPPAPTPNFASMAGAGSSARPVNVSVNLGAGASDFDRLMSTWFHRMVRIGMINVVASA